MKDIPEDMTPCHLCNESENLFPFWGDELVKCGNCGIVYRDPQPTFEELEKIYADEDYFRGLFYTDYVGDEQGFTLNFKHRLKTILQYSSTDGKLFEAGCAFGFFLKLAKSYWSDVEGIDMSPDAVSYAKNELGLNVARGDFESYQLADNSYDAVVMFDVIEHLYNPEIAIQNSAKALRKSGILALTTGDIGALLPRIQRNSWRLVIPQHLFYFSEESIRWLLNKHGLELVHFSHPGNYRSLGQYSHVIAWNNPESEFRVNLAKSIQKLPFMDKQFLLNLYDIMFVIARKI